MVFTIFLCPPPVGIQEKFFFFISQEKFFSIAQDYSTGEIFSISLEKFFL